MNELKTDLKQFEEGLGMVKMHVGLINQNVKLIKENLDGADMLPSI
ncbi:MAG: hypothetical protein OXI37_07820 [Gammaproteobacteria bacterium]|nr:hypothetical protein [Gammaproteobacteria bacterium]